MMTKARMNTTLSPIHVPCAVAMQCSGMDARTGLDWPVQDPGILDSMDAR